jgi:hypothetical protein
MGTYVTGLHVGDASGADSALVTIQRVMHPSDPLPKGYSKDDLRRAADWVQHLVVVAAERFDRPTIPELVDHVRRAHAVAPLSGDTTLVVNTAAGGRPLLLAVVERSGIEWRVPVSLGAKVDTVGPAVRIHKLREQVVTQLQAGRLKLAKVPELSNLANALKEIVDADDDTASLSPLAAALGLAVLHAARTASGDPWVGNAPPARGSEDWRRREQWKVETGRTSEGNDARDEWLRRMHYSEP